MDLDPLLPLYRTFVVGILVEAGRFDEAIEEFHRALELDPGSGLAYFHGGCAYFGAGRLDDARGAFERSLELTVYSGWAEGMLGIVHVEQGHPEAAERLLEAMLDKRAQGYVSPASTAFLSWRLGKADQAFELFNEALDERDGVLPLLNVYPFITGLRREPRFKAFLERLRFPAPA